MSYIYFVPPISTKPILNTILHHSKNSSLPIKRLSLAELKVRREKGLCYNCDNKYEPGRKCKAIFFTYWGL